MISPTPLTAETVAFDPDDALSQEWHLVVIAALCHLLDLPGAPNPGLDCTQRSYPPLSIWIQLASLRAVGTVMSVAKRLNYYWRILTYRPELETKLSRHTTAMDFGATKAAVC